VTPYQLIGLPYRLGANPSQHHATDCVGLCVAVLQHYGFPCPQVQRSWYRRLRRGDTSVFREQLSAWGEITKTPRLGCVALCIADAGYGLAVWVDEGWMSFVGSAVRWSPIDALQVVECYCPQR